jgi:hypothetical protein
MGMNRICQGRVSKVEIPKPGDKENPWQPPVITCGWKIQFDPANLRSYLNGTSLLSVSTAGRGAVSSETAPAFFPAATSLPNRRR